MADVLATTTDTVQEPETRPHETTFSGEQFLNNMWGVEPAARTEVQEPPVTPEPPKQETKIEPEPPKPWIAEFGWENEDAAKAEIAELRKLKETPQTPAEIKFENEQSKQIYELLKDGKAKEVKQFLETQERLDSYLSSEIDDKTAAEIIKMGMQLKYKDLTQSEIDYKFNKEFGLPKEPVQQLDELDEDFQIRKESWQEKVNEIQLERKIEAKLLKPELEKQKAQLVLPDISQQQVQKPPTQEELEAAKKYEAAYLQSVESSLKEFNGISVKVKNEDVGLPEISIDYSVLDTEKAALSQTMKDFAQAGFDANSLFAQRWVNEDQTLNTKLIAEDRYWLENRDKIVSKMTAEAATKAVEAYIKGKKNININEVGTPQTRTLAGEDKDFMDRLRDKVFS